MEENRIERHIDLKASPSRVWKALTDYREFGQWFGCEFEGPFVVGKTVRGKLNHVSYEPWEIDVKQMEPERLFSFTWHPYPVDLTVDYSKETPTLVEFTLEPTSNGTRLTVTESGFKNIPANRRLEAFRKNNEGWVVQLENIANYVR
ncbi:MAG: SRPBCC family protein [Anaerolineales bacterium]|nr:SRPBCC family protein [Anaerolineales bacterium]